MLMSRVKEFSLYLSLPDFSFDFPLKCHPFRAVGKFIAHFLSLSLFFLLPFNYMQFLLLFYCIPHRSNAECGV